MSSSWSSFFLLSCPFLIIIIWIKSKSGQVILCFCGCGGWCSRITAGNFRFWHPMSYYYYYYYYDMTTWYVIVVQDDDVFFMCGQEEEEKRKNKSCPFYLFLLPLVTLNPWSKRFDWFGHTSARGAILCFMSVCVRSLVRSRARRPAVWPRHDHKPTEVTPSSSSSNCPTTKKMPHQQHPLPFWLAIDSSSVFLYLLFLYDFWFGSWTALLQSEPLIYTMHLLQLFIS